MIKKLSLIYYVFDNNDVFVFFLEFEGFYYWFVGFYGFLGLVFLFFNDVELE